ncbi:MAG: hypothetical protein JWP93_1405 [Polaromonas sp.]|nr:hypothetical protein [Polaromonas sp.]
MLSSFGEAGSPAWQGPGLDPKQPITLKDVPG